MPLPHVKMTNVDGTELNLREAMKPGGLVVIFSCNTCPFVIEWEEAYNDINAVASANEVGMILVNSNEAKRDGDDSMKEMMEHAKAQKYSMPYVVDKDHPAVSVVQMIHMIQIEPSTGPSAQAK